MLGEQVVDIGVDLVLADHQAIADLQVLGDQPASPDQHRPTMVRLEDHIEIHSDTLLIDLPTLVEGLLAIMDYHFTVLPSQEPMFHMVATVCK